MKGTFRIGGAALLGVLIILGAFSMRDRVAISGNEEVVVAMAPERKAIGLLDENNNGIADWEDNLEEQVIQHVVRAASSTLPAEEPEPDTFTGKFSEAFVQDYVSGKMRGADFTDPTAFIGSAIKAIENNTQSERVDIKDIRTIPTTSETLRQYGNDVASIMNRHSIESESETAILERAITTNDAKVLEGLAPIRAAYEGMLADSRTLLVPDEAANAHVILLNAYSGILYDIKSMQLAFDDPLLALARIQKYEADAKALLFALQEIAKVLKEHGVVYGNEPGAMFFIFES